jgi:hypothetical protein
MYPSRRDIITCGMVDPLAGVELQNVESATLGVDSNRCRSTLTDYV